MEDGSYGQYVTVGGRRLRLRQWGEPGRVTVFLLHGIGDDSHVWDLFAGAAAGLFHLVALDQRGHGLSDWAVPPAYTCRDYVSDLEGVIEQTVPGRVILVGHSMGALHALDYAAHHPERAAAVVHADIEATPPEWNKRYLTNLYENLPRLYDDPEDYVAWMRKNSPHAEEGLLRRLAAHALTRSEDGRWRLRYDPEVLRHFDRYDLKACLGEIACPVLIVRGRESKVLSLEKAEEMRRGLRRARVVEIPDAAHPVHTDNPQGFAGAVMTFITSLPDLGGPS